jgi:hypothetical protein
MCRGFASERVERVGIGEQDEAAGDRTAIAQGAARGGHRRYPVRQEALTQDRRMNGAEGQ